MKMFVPLTIVIAAGAIFAACYEDRGILYVDSDGGAGQGGGAPNGGTGGNPGPVGGNAGTHGPTSGNGGTPGGPPGGGCDVGPIMVAHNCTLQGACHDAKGTAAGLDLTSLGWEQRLLGGAPSLAVTATRMPGIASLCANQGFIYLVPGSVPARGLFLDKLGPNPPCGSQMSELPPFLTAAERACFQRWANVLTAPAP